MKIQRLRDKLYYYRAKAVSNGFLLDQIAIENKYIENKIRFIKEKLNELGYDA